MGYTTSTQVLAEQIVFMKIKLIKFNEIAYIEVFLCSHSIFILEYENKPPNI